MTPQEYIARIRLIYPSQASQELLGLVSFAPSSKSEPDSWNVDLHGEFRNLVCTELIQNFNQPDRQFIRFLTQQEIISRQHNAYGVEILMCAYMLFCLGNVEDVFLIYKAKFGAGFDAYTGVDSQTLVGAGVDETIGYLQSLDTIEAKNVLAEIVSYRDAGEFNLLSNYKNSMRQYFGIE